MKKGSNLVDRLTLGFFRLFSGNLPKRLSEEQYRQNIAAWEKYSRGKERRMLEHQGQLSAFSYGKTSRLWEKLFLNGRELTAAENACEVIAVYNALCALRQKNSDDPDMGGVMITDRRGKDIRTEPDFPSLLAEFSGSGICANGLFGTSPKAIEKFFRSRGFDVICCVGRQISKERMEEMSDASDVCILTSFNRGQNPFSMVHTMCVTKEKRGWRMHNDAEGGKRYPTLFSAVTGYNGGRSHPIQVLGISETQKTQKTDI